MHPLHVVLSTLCVLFLLSSPSSSAVVAYFGPVDPLTESEVEALLEKTVTSDGTAIFAIILPPTDAAAAAELLATPDIIAVVANMDVVAMPLVHAAVDAANVPLFYDTLVPGTAAQHPTVYGGPSALDQFMAFIVTRKQLPSLDLANIIVILTPDFLTMEADVTSVLHSLTNRLAEFFLPSADATVDDLVAGVNATGSAGSVIACMDLDGLRVAGLIAALSPTMHQFFVLDAVASDVSDRLTTHPAHVSLTSSQIEFFTALPMSEPPAPRLACFLHGVSAVLSHGLAQVSNSTQLWQTVEFPGHLPDLLGQGLTIGPTTCLIDPDCIPCRQLFRRLHRVIIGRAGGMTDPEFSVTKDLSHILCNNETTQAEEPFVLFSSFFINQQSYIEALPDQEYRINIQRQAGAYSAVRQHNMYGGASDRMIEPNSFLDDFTEPHELANLYHRTNGSFVILSLFTKQLLYLGMVQSMEELSETEGIDMFIWGADIWEYDILLLNGHRNRRITTPAPLWSSIILAGCKLAAEHGGRTVFVSQYIHNYGPAYQAIAANIPDNCAYVGTSRYVHLNYPTYRDRNIEVADIEEMILQIAAIQDKWGGGEVTVVHDLFTDETTGMGTCMMLAALPNTRHVVYFSEPIIDRPDLCSTWDERVYVVLRNAPINISNDTQYLDSLVGFPTGPSLQSYSKWVQTRLFLAVLDRAARTTGEMTYDAFTDQLYSDQEFLVGGVRYGPYKRQDGDVSLPKGDVCNSMFKSLHIFNLAGDPANVTFAPTVEFGLDPVLDWYPYCDFFIPPVVIGATSLVALWITLGCVLLALTVSCCCCCVWCCLITIIAAIIARQRRTSDRYRVLRDQAQEAVRQKSMFVSNMSHELRTPLNAIIGSIDLIMDSPDLTDVQRQSLLTIGASSAALLAIVNDVLFAASLAAEKVPASREALDLPAVVEDAVRLAAASTEKPIDYLIYYLPGTPLTVSCDRRQLAQVLANILNNASKFTEAGHVRVVVGPDEAFDTAYGWTVQGGGDRVDADYAGTLRFEIDDSGVGIRPEDYLLVFERFAQLEHGAAMNFGGTGLGLHIAKQLVEAVLHGTITAGSSPDLCGARFTFTAECEERPTVWSHAGPEDVGRVALLDHIAGGRYARSLASLLLMAGVPADRLMFGTVNDIPDAECTVMCSPADPIEDVITTTSIQDATAGDADIVVPFAIPGVFLALAHAAGIEEEPKGRLAVVVADDEPVNRRMLSAFLTKCGAQYEVYVNGADLLAGVGDGRPDIAIVDYHMPVMDGPECARRLRDRLGADIHLILMTGDVSFDNTDDLFDTILIKPVRLTEFRKAVGQLSNPMVDVKVASVDHTSPVAEA